MSAICGIFSPRQPQLFRTADLEAMGSVLERSGVVSRRFTDTASGIGLALFHTPTFLGPQESSEPHWLTNDRVVIGLAGSLDPAARDEGLAVDGPWQAQTVHRHYEARLPDFPKALDGSFNLLTWDRAEVTLTLATDVAGSKQLYVFSDPASGYFAFASQLQALLKIQRVPREIDPEALAFYLRLGYVAAPMTLLAGVSKLLPFEALQVGRERHVSRRRYYQLPPQDDEPSGKLEDWIRPVHDEIVSAVERVSRRAPQAALYLSGGIGFFRHVGGFM